MGWETSFHGPGGDFRMVPRALFLFQYATSTKRKKEQVRIEVKSSNWNIMDIEEALIVSLRIFVQVLLSYIVVNSI